MKGKSSSKVAIVNKEDPKKKELLERLKNKSKATSENKNQVEPERTDSDEVEKYKKLYKSVKKDRDKFEKLYLEQKKSSNNKTEEDPDTKDLKKDLRLKNLEIRDLKKNHEKYVSITDSKLNTILEENDKLKEEVNTIKKVNEDLSVTITRQIKKEQTLEKGFKKMQGNTATDKARIRDLENEQAKDRGRITTLKQSLVEKEYKLNEMQQMSPALFIDLLMDKLSKNNLSAFKALPDLYDTYRKIINNRSAMKRNQKEKTYKDKLTLFGHVRELNNEYVFVDVDEKIYKIDFMPRYEGQILNAPVQALELEENNVQITYFYSSEENDKSMKLDHEKNKVKRKRSDSEEVDSEDTDTNEEYHYIGNFKVLLVTEKDKDKYVSRLEKHGLQVQVAEGRGKYNRLQTLIDSADVVIYLVEDITHVVSEQSRKDENPDKHHFIKAGNPDKVVQRVVYAKHQLGL